MKEHKKETEIPNFYKMIFPKNGKYPIGYHSKNLKIKIKDREKQSKTPINNVKNELIFHISDDSSLKLKKIYNKFQKAKSAKKINVNLSHYNLSPKNLLMNKKYNKISRPLSQYSTLIEMPKSNSLLFFKITKKKRPFSQFNKYSTLYEDNIYSCNNSKINTNKHKFNKINPKTGIKNRIIRNSSSLLFRNKKVNLFNNSSMKDLIKHENELKKKKKELKGRLLTALSKHLVINKDTYNLYNYLFKNDDSSEDIKLKDEENDTKFNKKKMFNSIIHSSNLFSEFKPSFRYEDYYHSPLDFMIKYFTKEEIKLLKSSPDYFGINKLPFKNSDFEYYPTLLSKLEHEQKGEDSDKSAKIEKFVNDESNKIDIKSELNRIRRIFKKKRKSKIKRKPIVGKDFVSHYEREIEADEGTVNYFERKYIKYLSNKEKRMEKKINNIKFKKSRFEFLKNKRTQKIEEDKNIQRITGPVINAIKKNYLRSNSIGS